MLMSVRVGLMAVFAFAGLLGASASGARESTLTVATDLAADLAQSTKQGIPIVILYSLAGCPQCEVIRRLHLTPLANENPPRAIVRQINLQSTAPIRHFDSTMTTQKAMIDQQKIDFAPVVVFYGAGGQRVGAPLVGSMLADFYSVYLDNGIAEAKKLLAATGKTTK